MSILDIDLDYNGTDAVDTEDTSNDFDAWMRAMLDGEETTVFEDPEDADWNENIFEGEDDEDEDPQVDALYRAIFEAPAAEVAPAPAPAPAKARDAKKCREWAQAQNLPVGKRGVIATEIWDAYLAS